MVHRITSVVYLGGWDVSMTRNIWVFECWTMKLQLHRVVTQLSWRYDYHQYYQDYTIVFNSLRRKDEQTSPFSINGDLIWFIFWGPLKCIFRTGEGRVLKFSGKRQQPNIYNTYLLTYLPACLPACLSLGFQPMTSSSESGCPTTWAIVTSQQGGLIMGNAFNSRDSRHEECSITTRGVCECKARILQAYF